MASQPIELSYRLTNLEYREMMDAYWALTPFRRGRAIFLQTIPVAAAAFAAYTWWKTGLMEALGLAALALSAPVVAPLINNWAYDRAFSRLHVGAEDMHLKLSGDTLEIDSSMRGQSRLPWAAVRQVSETPRTILLWLNPYQAVIVPRAAFPAPAEAEAFLVLARSQTAGRAL